MIRIAIVDDSALMRLGLRQAFGAEDDFTVVGLGDDCGDALQLARRGDIDVLVLAMDMPGTSGVELVKRIKAEAPRLPVLALCHRHEPQCVEFCVRAVRAGASTCLPKSVTPAELVAATRRICSGRPYVTPELAERLMLDIGAPESADPHRLLSDREYQIFTLLVAGRSVAQIADELCLSAKTVSTYKTRICQKTHIFNNVGLVRYALDHGLLGHH